MNLTKKEIKYENIENTNNDLISKMASLQEILSSKEKEISSLIKLNQELTQTNNILTNQSSNYKLIIQENENNHSEINTKIEGKTT